MNSPDSSLLALGVGRTQCGSATKCFTKDPLALEPCDCRPLQHGRGARRAIRGLKMGVTAFVWYQLYMLLIVALDFSWLRFYGVSSNNHRSRLQCWKR